MGRRTIGTYDQWSNNAGSYGSPPDPFGMGAVGLDQAGRPLYCGFNYLGNTSRYVGFGSSPTSNPRYV